jgi:hypothetical protein
MKNLNNKLFCFLCIFVSLNAFSQSNGTYPKIEVINEDTVIVFDIEQGKKLAIINETKKKLEQLNNLQGLELETKDSIINVQNEIIVKLQEVDKSNKIIIEEKNKVEQVYKEENKLYSDEIKKQKRYKWLAIISGITSTILMSLVF